MLSESMEKLNNGVGGAPSSGLEMKPAPFPLRLGDEGPGARTPFRASVLGLRGVGIGFLPMGAVGLEEFVRALAHGFDAFAGTKKELALGTVAALGA